MSTVTIRVQITQHYNPSGSGRQRFCLWLAEDRDTGEELGRSRTVTFADDMTDTQRKAAAKDMELARVELRDLFVGQTNRDGIPYQV